MAIKSRDCKARQHSDQLRCDACGLVWDVNDPSPPTCHAGVVEAAAKCRQEAGSQAIEDIRRLLAPSSHAAEQPVALREAPLKWLPAFGLAECLVQIDWASMPEASYAHIKSVHSEIGTPGRVYTFFTPTGTPLIEVEVFDDYDTRRCSTRRYIGPGFGDWQSL